MAGKNRKKVSKSLGISWQLMCAAAFLVITMLFYVWIDARVQSQGLQIKHLEQQQVELNKRYDIELWKWEKMISPPSIEAGLRKHQIVMVWPTESNIVRLQEPNPEVGMSRSPEGQLVQLAHRGRSMAHD